MSKKKIIAIVTVIVLLLAAGISVGVFLYGRGETQATDGNQVVDGNVSTDGTQTGENSTDSNNGDNNIIPPDGENAGEAGDNENVDNQNTENQGANNAGNNAGNTGVTTDTNVNNVGETTITRVEEKDKLVSEDFLDWWKPMQVKVNQKTALGVNEPELTVKKAAITGVGGDEFIYTGQNITYVIEVTNNSNEPINNIEIKDRIPQGTSFVSIEDATIEEEVVAEGTTIGEEKAEIGVKWVVTIPAGETVKARFTVKVTATEGTISNVAIANGEESTDPTKDPTDPDNETKTSIIKANKSSLITRDGKEVEIAKVGDLITYTITVQNTGDKEGTTYITDTVPVGTEFVSTPEDEDVIVPENKDSIAWSITLGANETVTKSFVVKVNDVTNGTIVNIANVGGTETEPDNVKVEAYIVFIENGGTEVEDITGVAGEKIENTAMPTTTKHGYVFEGWYAEETLTTEVDKLPETYPAGTTTYYAKWSPVTGLKGIVNYYLKDTTTKLAESKELTGLTFDTEITETAIDIVGYNKVEPTSAKIKVELEGNEINFYYTPRTDLTGIVNYYLKDTTTKLADSKELTGLIFNSEITETAIEIAGYNKVDPTSAKITVGLEGNEINFYYTPRTDLKGVVNYYLKDTKTKLAESKELSGLTFNSEIEEKAIDIPGYNKVDPTSAKITVALEGNEINFYYTPRTDLKGIVNYYLKDTTTKLADSKELTGLTFNSEITETAIEIAGYNKVEPTSAKITVALEGNEINFYYTPRTDLTGIVNYYLKDTTTKLADSKELTGLTFNSEIEEKAIEIPGYNKVDPTSAKITVALEGNEINFYYTPRTDLTGIVNYYLKDTKTKLAESKELTGLTFNLEIEEKAIDIPGYNKVDPTSAKITVALEGNEINFYYTPRTDLTGIVNYYLKDTTTKLADSKELTGLTFNSEIEEKAIDIPGYNKVDPTSAKITVALEGNEINFYYTPRTDLKGVVNYYLKDTKTKLADSKELTGLTFNSEIEEKAIEIPGYNKVDPTSAKIIVALEGNEINFYYTPRTDLKGIVNYYLKDTTTKLAESKELSGLTFNSEIEEKAIDIPGYNKVDPTSAKITVALEGNEINFYYTPVTGLEGIVNYYLKDTKIKLADSKPLTGLVFNSSVSENAIEIAGYNKVEPTSVTIKVALEGNEINFYYTPRTDLTGVVNYYLKDTTTKLAESKELSGLTFNSEIEEKAIDIPGYNKVDPTSAKIIVALEGNEINFYYTPRTDLTGVVNYYLKDTTTKLADSKELTGLTFNSEIEEKAIDIPGYDKVDPTSAKITVGLEGNEINFYYTPVTGLEGIVNYYLKGTTTKLADSKELTGLVFNSEIEEKAIDISGYNKVDPTSAKITVGLEGNEINFYYTPVTGLEGIVNYYLKDTKIKLADSKPLTGLVFNSSVSENAIEIAGYNKVEPTSVTIKVALEGNEINFYYTPRTDLTGVVNYYLKDTTTKLADSKPLTGLTFNSEIEEKAIDIPGYNKVDPTSAKIIVALEGNEINFYYTPRTDLTGVVNYYLKDTTTKLADSKELTGLTFNSEIEEKAIDIPGYNKVDPTSAKITVALEGNEINFYYTPRTDLTGIVNYYLKDTTTKLADSKELTGLTFNSEIEEKAIDIPGYNKVDPTSAKITVALEGNEINFYYTPRTDLTGIVNYYLKDTKTKLAESKELTGLTFNSEIEEKAIDIPGYNKVDPTSAKITVALEGNEINFYYTPRTDLTGIVNYYLKDTTTKLADSKELTGLTFNSEIEEKAIDIPGYDKVDPTSAKITVELEGNEINFYYTYGKSQYTVEYYYEINGNYPSKTQLNDEREGTTLSPVAVTAEDKTPTVDGYIFDAEYNGNVLEGTITPDGSLVLKVYFKQQIKVVYTKGTQGTFANQEYTVKYGDTPTAFNGTPTGNVGFHFVGWDKDVTKPVTEDTTFTAIWEGLQVSKTRLEIVDKDNLGNTDYVDQEGDTIRYAITVKNIGDIKAENIVLKDSLAVKVISVEIAGTEVEITNTRASNEFAANTDLLQGLTSIIEPNETIVVIVEHTVTEAEVKAALKADSKIINTATAVLNDNPYTGTDKTVDPKDGKEKEGTEVKQRCEYRVEYHYNGQLGTAADDVIESAAILGATISFETPAERKGYTYINYVGSTTVTEGTNLIIVNYGKAVTTISKTASATVDAGANIEYTLTVTNTGLVGTTVTVSDELVGTTYVPGSANIGEPTIINNVLTWQVTVGAQSTKTITFKATTPKTAFGETITNIANIKDGETLIDSSNEVSTTVNEVTVKYTEWKEGQQGTDLNIIFLLDNSASMNEPIEGNVNEYSNDNSYYVAPSDVTKTRLYNAKEAIKGFIAAQNNNPNTSMSVITFNSYDKDTISRTVLVKNEDINVDPETGRRYTIFNGVEYNVSAANDTIKATDGNNYCYITITINEGPVLVGNNSTSNAALTTAVDNITIGSRREGLGTNIAPAIDEITANSNTYLSSTKKNIVIVLADGDFDNPKEDSWFYGRGYVSAKNDLLDIDPNLEIYSVGFGNYVESTMKNVSTNNTCYSATNSSTILNKFNEILDEATGSEQTGMTTDGIITFTEATQTIKVSETCPIVATYETGAVDGEGNPVIETLFTCTSTADLATYGLTITGEKTISWDVKTFIANHPTVTIPNTVAIKYYIPII